MKRSSQLKTDPAKTRRWQQQSRNPLKRKSSLRQNRPVPLGVGNESNRAILASLGAHRPRKAIKQHRPALKGSVKDLERQLDGLTREVLRQDERVCFTDGKPGRPDDPLQVSHLFGRSQRPTRFDVHVDGNNHMMHESCNNRHNDDKSIYRDVFISRFGKDAYDEVDRRAHQGGVFDYVEMLRMIEQRQAMLR